MKFFDRILTILITATLTSAVWIIFGDSIAKLAEQQDEPTVVSAPANADQFGPPPEPATPPVGQPQP
jgi:hypothetical protein